MNDLPDLSIRQLRAIVVLSRSGKFVAAAAELGMSQPGLSRLIQHAEDLLRVSLFSRAARHVQPTSAGRLLIPVAERILAELQQQVNQVRTLDEDLHGQLIISSLMSLCHHVVPSALMAFRKEHIKIHIQVREGLNTSVHNDLRAGIADFGIGNINGANRHFRVEMATKENCFVVMQPGHHLEKKKSLKLTDLNSECMISMPAESGLRRLIDSISLQEGITLNHGVIISQYETLFGFVENGLGVSIVPISALSPSVRERLVIRELRPIIRREVGIIFPSDRPLTPVAARFLELFRPMFVTATTTF